MVGPLESDDRDPEAPTINAKNVDDGRLCPRDPKGVL
jgi:hypothetical protein